MALVYLPEQSWSMRYGAYACVQLVHEITYTGAHAFGLTARCLDKRTGPDYFTVAVIGFKVHDDRFAQYELQVQSGKRNWTLLRRFSEFDQLRGRYACTYTHLLAAAVARVYTSDRAHTCVCMSMWRFIGRSVRHIDSSRLPSLVRRASLCLDARIGSTSRLETHSFTHILHAHSRPRRSSVVT